MRDQAGNIQAVPSARLWRESNVRLGGALEEVLPRSMPACNSPVSMALVPSVTSRLSSDPALWRRVMDGRPDHVFRSIISSSTFRRRRIGSNPLIRKEG